VRTEAFVERITFASDLCRRRILGAALAISLVLGAHSTALAQHISLGPHGNWTALTVSPNGSWGAATHDQVGQAIAHAIARCKRMSGERLGCGAYLITTLNGWSVAVRCGDQNILATGSSLADAERAAAAREADIRRRYKPDMALCRLALAVSPNGRIVTERSGILSSK
jgi:hypothetical protein